jgi:hypothetical protein
MAEADLRHFFQVIDALHDRTMFLPDSPGFSGKISGH